MVEVDPKQTKRAEAFALWMNAPMPMVTAFKTVNVSHAQQRDVTCVTISNASHVYQMLTFIMEYVLEDQLVAHFATTVLQSAEYVRRV